ncbi:MAG: hypothetical protein AB7P52_05420 [Alphaproteobacteria bacterium]
MAVMVAAAPAAAGPWKNESGHPPRALQGGEWQEEWPDTRCKYEPRREPAGEYREKTACEGDAYPYLDPYHAHPKVVVRVPPPPATIDVPLN